MAEKLDINAYACILGGMKDFEPCLNLELRKANRVLSQIYDGYLHECGLKTSQFSILRAMHYLKKTTNSQLQEVLILDQTTLSRALKPLMRDGLIEAREGIDRRQKELSLTKQGLALYRRAQALWDQAQSMVSQRLGESGKHDLLAISQLVVDLKS